jgi:hypothetical protein
MSAQFLNDQWFELTNQVLAAESANATATTIALVIDIEARNAPAGCHALSHQQYRNGGMRWAPGLAPTSDVAFVLDYQTLRDIWLGTAGATGLDAYRAGNIQIDAKSWWVWNDLSALIDAPFPSSPSALQRVRAITLK